jgi:arginine decarboxylase
MSFSTRDAERLYGIDAWGQGYFGVNAQGHLTVHPTRAPAGIDIYALLSRLKARKVRFPVQIRFPQILESRVEEIFGAFDRAIREFSYGSVYRGVYPIKVNQHPDVVNALVQAGRGRSMGLEAGSKAELAIALSQPLDEDALIICNGYKDAAYVKLALRGVQIGRKVLLIAEKPQEIPLIIRVARDLRVSPLVGMRIRLQTRSSRPPGCWSRSASCISTQARRSPKSSGSRTP